MFVALALACHTDDPGDSSPDSEDSGTVPSHSDTGTVVPRDEDGDGWTNQDGDCDDDDPARFPGAYETVGDLIDADCDGGDGGSVPLPGPVATWHRYDPALQFGHALDLVEIDGNPGLDVPAGTQSGYTGGAAVLAGEGLEPAAIWDGPEGTLYFGQGTALLRSAQGSRDPRDREHPIGPPRDPRGLQPAGIIRHHRHG